MVINVNDNTGNDLNEIKEKLIKELGMKRISYDQVISVLVKNYKEVNK